MSNRDEFNEVKTDAERQYSNDKEKDGHSFYAFIISRSVVME
ncbi:MAG: hypothetical protein WCF23_17310 [Candidatus Nitrosopolaris sp.]